MRQRIIVLGIVVLVLAIGGVVFFLNRSPEPVATSAAPVVAPSASEYHDEVRTVVSVMRADDLGSANKTLSAVIALRVPSEAKEAHLELVMALTSYRDAVGSQNATQAAAATGRLRALNAREPWIGFAL